jgi:hypothetical protein
MAYRLKKQNIVLAIILIAGLFFYPQIKETWQSWRSTPTLPDPSTADIPEATPTDTLLAPDEVNITLNDSTHISVQKNTNGNIIVNGKEVGNTEDLPKAIEQIMKNIPEKDRPEALKHLTQQYLEQVMENSTDSIHLSKKTTEQINKLLENLFENINIDTLE